MSNEEIGSLPQIKEAEAFHGKFQTAQGFTFKDGRTVRLFAFERSYMVRCWNPNAPDDSEWSKQANFNLSPESLEAFNEIESVMGDLINKMEAAASEGPKGEP